VTETEFAAHDPNHPPMPRGLLERLHGLDRQADFDSAIQAKLAEQRTDNTSLHTARAVGTLLANHGIEREGLDPVALPDTLTMKEYTAADWDRLKTSETPLLAAWSSSNRIQQEHVDAWDRESLSWGGNLRGPHDAKGRYEDALLAASLPLVHGTSYAAVKDVMARDSFVGNRALAESGVDVLNGVGNTLGVAGVDRELGLDKYVFADYARPHAYRRHDQAEITVVFEPEAMDEPGTFITELDIADAHDSQGRPDYAAYMRGAFLPDDFRASMLSMLYHTPSQQTYWSSGSRSQMNQDMTIRAFMGGADGKTDFMLHPFSTWEVKMPHASTDRIRRLIFRDKVQYEEFAATYGSEYDCVYEPHLDRYAMTVGDEERAAEAAALGLRPATEYSTPRHPDIYGTLQRFDKELVSDYERRKQVLDQADPESVHTGYVALREFSTNEANNRQITLKPLGLQDSVQLKLMHDTPEEVAAAIQADGDWRQYFCGRRRARFEAGIAQVRYIDDPKAALITDFHFAEIA
jgi:hypothetical protein